MCNDALICLYCLVLHQGEIGLVLCDEVMLNDLNDYNKNFLDFLFDNYRAIAWKTAKIRLTVL